MADDAGGFEALRGDPDRDGADREGKRGERHPGPTSSPTRTRPVREVADGNDIGVGRVVALDHVEVFEDHEVIEVTIEGKRVFPCTQQVSTCIV